MIWYTLMWEVDNVFRIPKNIVETLPEYALKEIPSYVKNKKFNISSFICTYVLLI